MANTFIRANVLLMSSNLLMVLVHMYKNTVNKNVENPPNPTQYGNTREFINIFGMLAKKVYCICVCLVMLHHPTSTEMATTSSVWPFGYFILQNQNLVSCGSNDILCGNSHNNIADYKSDAWAIHM